MPVVTANPEPSSARRRRQDLGTGGSVATWNSENEPWLVLADFLASILGVPAFALIIAHLIATPVLYLMYGEFALLPRGNNSIPGRLVKLQTQIDELDRKLENTTSLRNELDEKMENEWDVMDWKLGNLNLRGDIFDKFIDEFGTKGLVLKEEFAQFFEEFKKARKNCVDEIRDYTNQIVHEEIARHAADGLAKLDYALASAGGKVLSHSETYGGGDWLGNRNRVSADAEKMIRPSFGEPGQCFPLKGESGFVEIRLSAAIVPEAVTLEHVAKNVAYDRLDAPKHCRISGWMQGQYSMDKKKFVLTEFTYDLGKSNAQTFVVEPAASVFVVDTIRFEFESNHGRAYHTCIYRLSVHGLEPLL